MKGIVSVVHILNPDLELMIRISVKIFEISHIDIRFLSC